MMKKENIELIKNITINGISKLETEYQLTSFQKTTLSRLSELFQCGENIKEEDTLYFIDETLEKYKTENCLLNDINNLSIALSELMYLKEFKGKDATPINIQRFSFEIFDSGNCVQPEAAIILAIKILIEQFEGKQFNEEQCLTVGKLESAYHHAILLQSTIFSKVNNFNDDAINAYVDFEIHQSESELRKFIRELLPQKGKQHRLKMHLNNWIKENICVPKTDLKKYLDRLIAEERYLLNYYQ